MHELSIANALLRLAEEFRPDGHRVETVYVQAGPLQAIEPNAMQWAWQAARSNTDFDGASLDLRTSPWKLKCAQCYWQWEANQMDDNCRCGSADTKIVGGDELLLMSLDVVCTAEVAKGDR